MVFYKKITKSYMNNDESFTSLPEVHSLKVMEIKLESRA